MEIALKIRVTAPLDKRSNKYEQPEAQTVIILRLSNADCDAPGLCDPDPKDWGRHIDQIPAPSMNVI